LGKVQKELKIKPEASYVISVKNPFAPAKIELENKPSYPERLRGKFDGHSWIAVEPTSFLDYKWTQVLLLGARTNVERELGIKLSAEIENRAERAVLEMMQKDEEQAEQQGVSLLEPLEKGRWE
jgi:hypothetical protein